MSIKLNILKITAAFIAVIILFCSCGTAEKPSARVTVDGTKFVVNGSELWLSGMNAPWQNWNDFDGHMDVDFWEREFKRFRQDKINCVRIWVNCTGESIVDLNSDGSVKSVNEAHWTDLEKLFELARRNEVYVMATLLSFDHFKVAGQIGEGDIIVAGSNFGCGSSREQAPEIIKALKVKCVIAKSFARIFFRNSINNGLLLIENDKIQDAVKEGDEIEVTLGEKITYNGTDYEIHSLPDNLMEIINAGGLVEAMKKRNGVK